MEKSIIVISVIVFIVAIIAMVKEKGILNEYGYVIGRIKGYFLLLGVLVFVYGFPHMAIDSVKNGILLILLGIVLMFLTTFNLFRRFEVKTAIKLLFYQLMLGLALTFRIATIILLFFIPKKEKEPTNSYKSMPDRVRNTKGTATSRVYGGRVYFEDGRSSRLEKINDVEYKDQYGNYYSTNL